MKRKLNSVYLLFAILLVAFFQLSHSNNPNNGYTGAPPSGNTCASSQGGCHSGGSGTGMITISGVPAMAVPNQVYPLTVTIERTNSIPDLAGFQMVAQQSNNSNAGMMSNPSQFTTVQLSGGKYYFEHNPAQSFATNTLSFTVDWTAPATSNGAITFYAAANLADGNNNTNGDAVVTTTATTNLPAPLNVSVTGTNVSCWGGNNGSATANATGGSGSYTYLWSNGGNTQTINNLTAGTYTVTVSTSGGNSGTGSVTITQPPQVSAAIVAQTNITCSVPLGSATAQASGGVGSFTYAWSNGQNGPTATFNAPGNYTVTATDGNGCTDTEVAVITANTTPPNAEAGPNAQLTCTANQVTLNGTGSSTGGGITYLWTTPDGHIVSGATTLSPLVDEPGTYNLTVTNSNNGCTASDFATVTQNVTPPVSNAGPDGLLTCAVTQLTLNGTGSSTGNGITYLWTTANGNIVSGETTLNPVVDEPGTYCLTVTNTANGCTTSDCASVSENITPPIANAGSAPPLTCTNTQVTLNGTASSQGNNYTYLWSGPGIVSGGTTLTPVVNAAGQYCLTVTNTLNGCTASSCVTVSSNTTPPTASAGPDKALNCNSTQVVLDGTGSSQGGNFIYLWSGPGIVSGGDTPSPTVDTAGTYVILVTNTQNGCTKTDTALVVQTPTLGAGISASQNVSCNGGSNGSATAAGTGGRAPYSYAWSNNANTAQITNLSAGTYTATVTDADNCTATASVAITQPPVLNPNASATPETSSGANDGTATASTFGGVAPYAWAWSNGLNTQTITGLAPGNYTVSVTDANGCTANQTVTVATSVCTGFQLSLASQNPSCNGFADGSATATPSGGTGPYTFEWSNDETTASIDSLPAGSYTVSIADANGCEITGNVTLTAPPVLNLTVQQNNVACFGDSTATASVSATGGTPGYSFEWSNGGSGASQSNLPAGTYTVSVADENGCEATIQVTISQPPLLTGSVAATGETGVDLNDGTASVAPTGGVTPYTYIWTNTAGDTIGTSSAINNLPPDTYCVSLTDANGCAFTGCATVTAFGCVGQAVSVASQNVTCAGGNDGSAQVTATGFADPVNYLWSSGAAGSSVGNLAAGTYTVSITDGNGCNATAAIEIEEPTALSLVLLEQNNVACAGGSSGSLTVGGTGGTPGYNFSWSNGQTGPTVSDLTAGVYEVSISDENNCTATASFEVVETADLTPPTAIASDLTVSLSLSGTANITPQQVDGGSIDNCGVASVTLDQSEFTCADLGNNMVTLTVTDAAGNSSQALATVTVVDEMVPIILCPPTVVVQGAGCSTTVDYPLPTGADNCGVPNLALVSGLESGATFPTGTTVVTWSATDASGNSSTCSFEVTVDSDFGGVLTYTEPTCFGGNDGTATAQPLGGTPPYAFAWNDPAQQTTQTATNLTAGTYSVVVSDASGCVLNLSGDVTEPTPLVIVVDEIQPSSDIPGAIFVTVSGGTGNYSYQWFNGFGLASEAEDPDDIFTDFYQLVVTDMSGCTAMIEVFLPGGVGTTEEELERRIVLLPNPANDRASLRFELEQAEQVSFQLLDLTGRPALPAQQPTFFAKQNFELDLSELATGVYLVRVIVGEAVVVKRLIVQ